MAISQIICGSHGHNIASLKAGEKPVPVPTGIAGQTTATIVGVYMVACTACGLSLEEIKELDKKRNRSPRVKAAAQEATS